MADKLWSVASGLRVVDEDGALVAAVVDAAIASEIVEDHNMGVEIERDDTPEIRKSRAQQNAERVAAWRAENPDGARPVRVLSENVARMARLLSLKAPPIILGECAKRTVDLANSLAALFPVTLDEED